MERYPGWNLGLASRVKAVALRGAVGAALGLSGRRRGVRSASVEGYHRPTGSLYWNESYYFNFTDPVKKMGGFTRIGILPNQQTSIGLLCIYLEDGGIDFLVQSEECEDMREEGEALSVGLLAYEMVRPLWEWKVRFSGAMLHFAKPAMLLEFLRRKDASGLCSFHDVEVDLSFVGWSPCHDFKNMDARAFADRFVAKKSSFKDLRRISKIASEHYEQVGSWKGSIRVEGMTHHIHGTGHRDHSWGQRDWKAPSTWTWLTSQFDGALGFNVSRVVIGSMDVVNGFVSRDGKNYPLRRVHLETEFEPDGLTQKQILIRAMDSSGWEMEVEAEALCVVPLVHEEKGRRTLINEAFTEYRWDGRTAYGISEYLHQVT